MLWGYACPWYSDFMKEDDDPLYARLKFLLKHGLQVTGCSLREILALSEEELERLAQFLEDNDLQLAPHVGFDFVGADGEESEAETYGLLANLTRLMPLLRGTIVKTTACAGHRFDRELPLEHKLERLAEGIAPLAVECEAMGTPLCIENHGDFYCSDLVQVCERTQGLFLFLDTGNTYLIGEQPWPAIEAAAPHTLGTHFKDHRVRPCPDARPLHFEVAGSPLGEGDVPLRECYDLLLECAPDPANLVMEMEMISPDDMDPTECLERSLDFVQALPAP